MDIKIESSDNEFMRGIITNNNTDYIFLVRLGESDLIMSRRKIWKVMIRTQPDYEILVSYDHKKRNQWLVKPKNDEVKEMFEEVIKIFGGLSE